MPEAFHESFCIQLQKDILKWTGIPTSIGIGKTKTLAKAANHLCKKVLKISVFKLNEPSVWLQQIAVDDVWGVGRKWGKKLVAKGIHTAFDLANLNAPMIKKQYNVVLMRTVMELQGIACAGLEVTEPKQSIMSSKSFGEMQTHFTFLAQAISSHCARACEKAREQNLVAKRLYVFIRSNPHRHDLAQYSNSIDCRLVNPTADTCLITKIAKLCLKKIYRPGISYKKVGVMLEDLVDESCIQLDLFHQPTEELSSKRKLLMTVFDAVNSRYGSHTMKLAAEGCSKPWAMRSALKSPAYTTRWTDLPRVYFDN